MVVSKHPMLGPLVGPEKILPFFLATKATLLPTLWTLALLELAVERTSHRRTRLGVSCSPFFLLTRRPPAPPSHTTNAICPPPTPDFFKGLAPF